MPFRLSDPAWLAFQNSIDVSRLALPPWGGVVQWGSQYILVYICPGEGEGFLCRTVGIGCRGPNPLSICQPGEVMLTDVSDRADLIKNIPRMYDPGQGVWVYQIPAAFMSTLLEESKAVIQATGQIIQTVAETAGAAAGGLTKPLLENLTVPLIGLGLVLAFVYLPKPR